MSARRRSKIRENLGGTFGLLPTHNRQECRKTRGRGAHPHPRFCEPPQYFFRSVNPFQMPFPLVLPAPRIQLGGQIMPPHAYSPPPNFFSDLLTSMQGTVPRGVQNHRSKLTASLTLKFVDFVTMSMLYFIQNVQCTCWAVWTSFV